MDFIVNQIDISLYKHYTQTMEQSRYSVEELIANESFQAYCIGRSLQAEKFWKEYFKRFPDEKPNEQEAKRLYLSLSGNHDPKQYALHLTKFKLLLATGKPESKLPRQRIRWNLRRPQLAAAVLIFLLSSAIYLYLFQQAPKAGLLTRYSTSAGQTSSIELSDGSTVILNSSSAISFEKGFGKTHRSVRLSGEAFFNVRHDDKLRFEVRTKDLIITDLGTKFNVMAYANELKTEASLLEGVIEVATSWQPTKKIRLKPDEKIVYHQSTEETGVLNRSEASGSVTITPVTKNSLDQTLAETDWMQHKLTFNDENFEDIAKKIERWYGVKVEIKNPEIKKYRFVASFEDESLTEVLDFLINSREFKYRKEADLIIIY